MCEVDPPNKHSNFVHFMFFLSKFVNVYEFENIHELKKIEIQYYQRSTVLRLLSKNYIKRNAVI